MAVSSSRLPSKSPLPRPPRPQGGRPTLEEAKQITARIVDAASDLFLSVGFGATGIDQIAAAARISKRTFYTRFPSKQALFAAVVERKASVHLKPVRLVRDRRGSLEDHLVDIASAFYKMIFHPDVIALDRLVSIEAVQVVELARALMEIGGRQVAAIVEAVFAEALGRGELVVDDTGFLAAQFVNAMVSGPFQRVRLGIESRRTGKDLRRHLKRSVSLFLFGCAKVTNPPPDSA